MRTINRSFEIAQDFLKSSQKLEVNDILKSWKILLKVVGNQKIY